MLFKQILTAGLAAVAIVSWGAEPATQEKPAEKKAASGAASRELPPAVVKTAEVAGIYGSGAHNYIALVKAGKQVQLQPRVSGIIKEFKFKEGQYVRQGELLVDIEDTTYKAKVDTAKANLKKAQASLILAQATFERNKRLVESHSISEQALDESRCNLMTAEAEVNYAQAALVDAENDLSYTKVYAPCNGIIGITNYSSLNYVTPQSDPMVSLMMVDFVKVQFTMSDRDFLNFGGRKNIADEVALTLFLPNGEIYREKGEITVVDNAVDQSTGTIALIANYENKTGLLNPGSYLTIQLASKTAEPRPSVPVTAILNDANGSFVYVVESDDSAGPLTVRRREVELGEVSGVNQIVNAGLKIGEKVVSSGTHKVVPNGKIVESK